MGVFVVSSPQEGFFTDPRMRAYQTLSEQGGTALYAGYLFDEIQRTADRLREVDRMKSEFLANMSHELRTPLNSILGYAELILMDMEEEFDPETLEDMQSIYKNGKHLLSLINDILDLAKIEAGRLTLNFEPVEVEFLLEDVRNNTASLFVSKPVEMLIDVEEGLPAIQADSVRVKQILNNLVANGVKFTEEGHVRLHAFKEGDGVCIEVEDTGMGISEEDLETIFERFRQVDGSFTRRAEGTGLGLSITRHLVHMHGGSVDVRSKLGQGSTFIVRLPFEPPQLKAASGEEK
jgi:signal transduction histidine kinase